MADFRYYVRHALPGSDEPESFGVPYHSEAMARGAFDAACRVWEDFDVDLLDAGGRVLAHHDARGN